MTALPLRPSRRVAIALAIGACLASPGIALADTLYADGQADPGPQDVDLGVVALGAVIDVPFSFLNHCTNGSHLDADQVVSFTFAGGPAGRRQHPRWVRRQRRAGARRLAWRWLHVPQHHDVPDRHGRDGHDPGSGGRGRLRVPHLVGQACSDPARAGDSLRHPRPARPDDPPRGRRTAPVVTAPDVVTVEGNMTGGWAIDWSGIASATDAEDGALPVSCLFNAPSVLSVGSWTILCSATDSLGAVGHDAFALNVLDTTAPAIAGHAPVDVTTADAGGAIVTYDLPAATDVVDLSPTVTRAPPSGDTFAVGTTTVTRTATDDSGNSSSRACSPSSSPMKRRRPRRRPGRCGASRSDRMAARSSPTTAGPSRSRSPSRSAAPPPRPDRRSSR